LIITIITITENVQQFCRDNIMACYNFRDAKPVTVEHLILVALNFGVQVH